MLLQEFEPGMRRLASRFSKRINDELIDIYYQRVKRLPEKAWREIVDIIIDESRYFPTPGELKRLWWQWLDDHPSLKVKRRYLPCDYCNGEGALTERRLIRSPIRGIGTMEYDSLCRCGHCENWREVGYSQDVPIRTAAEVQKMGKWIVAGVPVSEERPWPARFMKGRSVNDITKKLANKFAMPKDPDQQDTEKRIEDLRDQARRIQDVPF
jgi:hypothetical protein